MKDVDLNQRLAARLAGLRAAAGWSLEALAGRSGVSRSMISLIERGETSPTAVVLERLATALGQPLAALFDAPAAVPDPLARAAGQPVWQDPHSGYRRRNVSPAGVDSGFRIVEVWFPPGARVAYETAEHDPPLRQQVWVLEDGIELRVGEQVHALGAGDCLAMRLDAPVSFHNPHDVPARYAVVIAGREAS